MPVRHIALACSTALVLAFSGSAQAALPMAAPKLIVPGKSIGGVAMKMAFADAKTEWGRTGACIQQTIGSGSCRYDDDPQATTGVASFTARADGEIDTVMLLSPYLPAKGGYVPTGPLTKFHTAKKIHIGSKLKAVTTAYPKAKVAKTGASVTIKSGHVTTSFYLRRGKVFSIAIARSLG